MINCDTVSFTVQQNCIFPKKICKFGYINLSVLVSFSFYIFGVKRKKSEKSKFYKTQIRKNCSVIKWASDPNFRQYISVDDVVTTNECGISSR